MTTQLNVEPITLILNVVSVLGVEVILTVVVVVLLGTNGVQLFYGFLDLVHKLIFILPKPGNLFVVLPDFFLLYFSQVLSGEVAIVHGNEEFELAESLLQTLALVAEVAELNEGFLASPGAIFDDSFD